MGPDTADGTGKAAESTLGYAGSNPAALTNAVIQ